MSDKFKGHTEGPLDVINHCGGYWLLAPYHFCKPTAENIKNIADAELYAAAPELLAENERLRARIAELKAGYRVAIDGCEYSGEGPAFGITIADAHRAVLDGVVASVADYDAYLAAQLNGAQP